MNHIDLDKPTKVHFTGIGGISMSGFAQLLLDRGFTVTGSDWKKSALTERLEAQGARISYGMQRAGGVDPDTGLLVYTAAAKGDNPELEAARALGIPCIDRGELAGEIMLYFKRNFSIAGTHGKTTTTSMIAMILMEAGLDPTVSVGGVIPELGGNFRIGHSGDFVIESCEYTDSFLDFHPTHAIITNIEAEHLDYFKTFERMQASFGKFAELLPEDGLLVYNTSIADPDKVFAYVACRKVSYSVSDETADYYCRDIAYDRMGCPSFTLCSKDGKIGRIELGVPGEHNASNACGAAAMMLLNGIPFEKIASALKNYHGTARRFEKKGEVGGVTIVDDYAHHPTEIKATLSAAAKYPHKELWVVFQPHTYSRTASFLNEIAEALSSADHIVLADIYAARETNTFGVSSLDVCNILKDKFGKDVYYFPSFDEIETFLLGSVSEGDLLITMGAGDILKVGESLLGK